MRSGFEPGDRVIDLRAVTRSAGLISGLITTPLAAWLAAWSWGGCALALLVGAGTGLIIGVIAGRIGIRTPPDHTLVTRPGVPALKLTLQASLWGSLAVGGLVAVASLLGPGGMVAAGISITVGVAIGVGVGCLSALL